MADAGRVAILGRGEWNSATSYEILDMVTFHNILYLAQKNSLNQQPSTSGDTEFWQLLFRIPEMEGASGSSSGEAGIVPAPAAGDDVKVLFGNGEWGEIPQSGHTILDENGTAVEQQPNMQFTGAHVHNDTESEATIIDIASKLPTYEYEESPVLKDREVGDKIYYDENYYTVTEPIDADDPTNNEIIVSGSGANVELDELEVGTNTNIIGMPEGGGPGGGGGHVIVNRVGTQMTQRAKLKFNSGLRVTDDSTNEQTVVDLDNTVLAPYEVSPTQDTHSAGDLIRWKKDGLTYRVLEDMDETGVTLVTGTGGNITHELNLPAGTAILTPEDGSENQPINAQDIVYEDTTVAQELSQLNSKITSRREWTLIHAQSGTTDYEVYIKRVGAVVTVQICFQFGFTNHGYYTLPSDCIPSSIPNDLIWMTIFELDGNNNTNAQLVNRNNTIELDLYNTITRTNHFRCNFVYIL